MNIRSHLPLAFTLIAVALMCTLGVWQLQRLQQKNALLAGIESAQGQPILGTLPDAAEEISALTWRSATLTGTFLPGKRFRFIGRQSNGYVWYAPLKLDDSDVVVLAALDWLPPNQEPTLGETPQTVKGVLRLPHAPRQFSPANQPEKNLWFTEDMPALSEASGAPLAPLVLDKDARPVLRNDHLGYAVTWFLLALAAGGMYLYGRKKRSS